MGTTDVTGLTHIGSGGVNILSVRAGGLITDSGVDPEIITCITRGTVAD